MKAVFPLLFGLVLAACATAPAPQGPAPVTTTQSQAEAPSRTLLLLQGAGAAEAPTQGDIERLLGAPDIARQDGAGAALTYRYEQCALLLLFSADGRNTMRLAEAHPSARRAGAGAPSLAQCAAEAEARGA